MHTPIFIFFLDCCESCSPIQSTVARMQLVSRSSNFLISIYIYLIFKFVVQSFRWNTNLVWVARKMIFRINLLNIFEVSINCICITWIEPHLAGANDQAQFPNFFGLFSSCFMVATYPYLLWWAFATTHYFTRVGSKWQSRRLSISVKYFWWSSESSILSACKKTSYFPFPKVFL